MAAGHSDGRAWVVVHPQIPWLRYAAVAVFSAIVILISSWLPSHGHPMSPETRNALEAVLGAICLVVAIWLFVISRVSSLRVGRDGVIFVNSVGLSRTLARGSVQKIIHAGYTVSVRNSFTVNHYLFLDENRRALLTLPARWWPQEGIDAVGQVLGVTVTGTLGTIDGPTFRREFPGSISWVAAHSVLTMALLFLPALFIIVVLITLVTGQ